MAYRDGRRLRKELVDWISTARRGKQTVGARSETIERRESFPAGSFHRRNRAQEGRRMEWRHSGGGAQVATPEQTLETAVHQEGTLKCS